MNNVFIVTDENQVKWQQDLDDLIDNDLYVLCFVMGNSHQALTLFQRAQISLARYPEAFLIKITTPSNRIFDYLTQKLKHSRDNHQFKNCIAFTVSGITNTVADYITSEDKNATFTIRVLVAYGKAVLLDSKKDTR